MKHVHNLCVINGGFSTNGAILGTLLAVPIALGSGFITKAVFNRQPNLYVCAGLTAGTIVYCADWMKTGDQKIIETLGDAVHSIQSFFTSSSEEKAQD